MCIRDSLSAAEILGRTRGSIGWAAFYGLFVVAAALHGAIGCLLYTSDAAHERSSVDLGGRRTIKKKTTY